MKLVFIFLVSLLFSSCATVFTGSQGKIYVNSIPEGASVFVNENMVGTTPCEVRVHRGVDWNNDMVLGEELTLELEGYQTKKFIPTSEFNSVSIFNLFQVYFWAVDLFTGAMWVYNPKDYLIKLEKDSD
jgi:hypothetical protein